MYAPRNKTVLSAVLFGHAVQGVLAAALLTVWCAGAAFAQAAPEPQTIEEPAARTNAVDPAGPPGPEPLSGPTATAGEEPVPAEHDTFVDRVQKGISDGLLISAVWLDSFFGDERYEAESNQSHFKVSDTVLFEAGDWTRYRPDYELRLVLPQLRRKTRLVISGDIWNDAEGPAGPTGGVPPSTPTPEDRELNTSIQVVLPSHDYHSTTVRSGAKYHSGEIVYYAGPRYRYRRPLWSWTGRFTENVVWFSDKGWESRSRFDLERPVLHDLFFRASAEGTWTEDVDGYLYSYTFLLRQPLDVRRAVEYEWVNSCHTRPVNELTEVKLVFRYRQQIWRRWLFMEIAPQYRFPRASGFEDIPGITFKLEMLFKGLHT